MRRLSLALGVLGCAGSGVAPAIPPGAPSFAPPSAEAEEDDENAADVELAAYIRSHYDKREARIPMRDGVELFTSIYVPKDMSEPRPIMLLRTPYSVRPYGEGLREKIGPSDALTRRNWIYVWQDVRGRFMSDGTFTNMTPHLPEKKGSKDVDESTDTHDTIAWLLDNVPGVSGRVGQWGISYPGFYAAAGMIDAHPALVAVSPQAPIADWFFDDFHHHGAFFLPHCFNFMASFGKVREGRYKTWPDRFDHGTPDGYAFFLALGSLRNANDRYLQGKNPMWNEMVEHPNYDAFWQRRNLLPHLKNVAPAVMVVGGLFDAEDLYGPLQIYRSIEAKNAKANNTLVMGPWQHGGWARTSGERLGRVDFGAETSAFYQEEIEAPFFIHHLEEGPEPDLPEAYVFETGLNRWRRFEQWPPKTERKALYPRADGSLTESVPAKGASRWVSDPGAPVPFTETIGTGMDKHYMTADQRFAARRPDVMVYETEPLAEPLTLAGPITATLFVSTTQRDADFVVKVIDVFPRRRHHAGRQRRGRRFRRLPDDGPLRGDPGALPGQLLRAQADEAGCGHEDRAAAPRRAAHLRQGPPRDGADPEHVVSAGRPQPAEMGRKHLRSPRHRLRERHPHAVPRQDPPTGRRTRAWRGHVTKKKARHIAAGAATTGTCEGSS